MRIAVLEDDPAQAQMFTAWLEEAGHTCHGFRTGSALVHSLGRESFDLLLLDWEVPEMSGPEVLEWVRNTHGSSVPVLFVTAHNAEASIVHALTQGADDYLVKPVRRLELLARLGALWRRTGGSELRDDILECGRYRIDVGRRRIALDGALVELTDKEFELALFLFQALGRVVSRGHIMECVWGRNADVMTRTVDTHVSRLRSKLQIGPRMGLRLNAVYSYGYRLEIASD